MGIGKDCASQELTKMGIGKDCVPICFQSPMKRHNTSSKLLDGRLDY
jgi:hypothetical protein